MPNEPCPHLLQHYRLTRNWHSLCPLPVDAQPKSSTITEGNIHQFDFQLTSTDLILNDHYIVRFGTSHTPFYRFNGLITKHIL